MFCAQRKAGLDRIAVNVAADREQLSVGRYQYRLVAPSKQRTVAGEMMIGALRVSTGQPLHGLGQQTFLTSQEQVIVIVHQAVGMDFDAVVGGGFVQTAQEEGSRAVAVKDCRVVNAAIEYMVPCAGIVHTRLSRHDFDALGCRCRETTKSHEPLN